MKKQTKFILIAIISAIFLAACGSDVPNRVTGEVQNLEQGSAAGNAGNSETGAGAASSSGDDSASSGQSALKGYTFTHAGTTISVDADFAPLLASLGEPRSYFEAASCAFEGLDKMYNYGGFTVNTYPQGDDEFVSSVILNDDTVATPEGVRIGSSFEDMERAYGPAEASASGQIIYRKDGMKLGFILRDEMIVAIEYLSLVLEEE
jgi:hypothetical protein